MKTNVSILISFVVLLTFSCEHEKEIPTKDFTGNRLALLQVDYETFVFEGGVEYLYDSNSEGFTIRGEYESPGDFGWVKLYFDGLDTLIFSGTIVWSGTGAREFPVSLSTSAEFDLVEEEVVMPPVELFNGEFEGVPTTELSETVKNNIWNAINKLELVSAYRNMNPASQIHIYLYRPSVGIGNPAEWDWLVFLKN